MHSQCVIDQTSTRDRRPAKQQKRLHLSAPAATEELVTTEKALGILLPDELVRPYRAANDQQTMTGQSWVVWRLHRMAGAQSWLKGIDGYLDDWIAFGDDGAGATYCFPRFDDSITRLTMSELSHERVAIDSQALDHGRLARIAEPSAVEPDSQTTVVAMRAAPANRPEESPLCPDDAHARKT
jgi:hypothetical protein